MDCVDACPDDVNKIAEGQCGCGMPDTDSDADGTADCNDGCVEDPAKSEPGQCGCGVADVDTDGDGTADCQDNCPEDPNKTEPGDCGCGNVDSVCGCGVPETDYNDNGTFDCQEDCNQNQIPDVCDIDPDAYPELCNNFCRGRVEATSYVERLVVEGPTCGLSEDCDADLIPDECQYEGNDCNMNEQYDGCETDTDGDGVIDDCEDCDEDPNKLLPGDCGCGVADEDLNENGVSDCMEECSGICDPENPVLDEDGDGVTNCQEILDETNPCDPGSFLDKLNNWACAGPNSFWGQINIATVMNQRENSLRVRAQYRDLRGVEHPAVQRTLGAYEKWDMIVNDLGMEPDSYGTFCVYTDAEEQGAWSGGLAVYKRHEATRRPREGFSASSEFDFALYYPFTAPRRGTSVVSLNTNAINAQGEVADWVRLTDGTPNDGVNLAGTLFFYNKTAGWKAQCRLL
jgi:hypothetical protein